jgi:hypothetical protein
LDDCTKRRTETARQMVQSFIRRDHTPGGKSMTRIRSSSELPDDEGRVFVTLVPDAPFQVMGRRANSGELFVRAMVPKGRITTENLRDAPVRVEVITGQEAEDLIAAVLSEGKAYGVMPAFVFERRRDIELETGLILAGALVIDIPKHVKLEERHQRLIMENIIGPLIKMTKSGEIPDSGIVFGWHNDCRPANADEITDNRELISKWAEPMLKIAIRVDPRNDEFVRIDSDLARDLGLTRDH